jgi:hypothetical protein
MLLHSVVLYQGLSSDYVPNCKFGNYVHSNGVTRDPRPWRCTLALYPCRGVYTLGVRRRTLNVEKPMNYCKHMFGLLIVFAIAYVPAAFGQIPPLSIEPSASKIQSITVLGNQSDSDVTGAPFSAVEESMYSHRRSDQTLEHRSSETTHFYRDGQGRTRAERYEASYVGETKSWLKSSYIADPVAGFLYELDPKNHKATRWAWDAHSRELAAAKDREISSGRSAAEIAEMQEAESHAKTESLGISELEGLRVEGYRQSLELPKGAIGNERSFEVVFETWISPELQVAVKTTRDTGTTVRETQLTKIDRSEPDPTLFRVPADYRLEYGGVETVVVGGTAP